MAVWNTIGSVSAPVKRAKTLTDPPLELTEEEAEALLEALDDAAEIQIEGAYGGVILPYEHDCQAAWQAVMEEVGEIASLDGPIARNEAITAAYTQLAEDMPENDWVRLASYVSVQGGCAMQASQSFAAKTGGRLFFNPNNALEALGEANLEIFQSIYPPNRMAQQEGYDQFKECVDSGEIDGIDPQIMDALEEMNQGNLKDAANRIAAHEQRDVVQPVYDKHEDTFKGMSRADRISFWDDRTSIPVAKECTRNNLVPFEGDISNYRDRIKYYEKLIEEMYRIEGASGSGGGGR